METNQANNLLSFCNNCRICLQINQQMTSIHSLKELNGFSTLLTFFNVEVMADARYPNKICIVCLNQLRNIVLFKQKCESSFNYLKNILNDDEFQMLSIQIENLVDNDKLIKTENLEENNFEQDTSTDERCHETTDEMYHEIVNKDMKPDTSDITSFLCNKCNSTSEICNCVSNNIKSEDGVDESKENLNLSSESKTKNCFKCRYCEKTFVKPSRQLRHQTTHERKFKCDRCLKSFQNEDLLTRHIRIHLGLKPFPCAECSRSFSRNSTLTAHKKLYHSENPPPRKTCKKCGIAVVNLSGHMKNKHSAHRFQCQYCNKKFLYKSVLTQHVSDYHENCEESFKVLCTLCGKKFRRVADLNRHNKANHCNERNYQCRYCDRRFKTCSARYSHEQSHLNDRRFKCTYCPKAFNTKDILESHILIHTGEKPFSCSICSKAFRQDGTLRNHTRLVHGCALIKKNNV